MKIDICRSSISYRLEDDYVAFERGSEEDGYYGYGSTKEDAFFNLMVDGLLERRTSDILRAINSHDDLVIALKRCLDWLDENHHLHPNYIWLKDTYNAAIDVIAPHITHKEA